MQHTDMGQVLEAAEKYYAKTIYSNKIVFKKEDIRRSLLGFMMYKDSEVFVYESGGEVVGLLAITIRNQLWNSGAKVAEENLMFSNPGTKAGGVALRALSRHAIKYAKEKNCVGVAISATYVGREGEGFKPDVVAMILEKEGLQKLQERYATVF